ncbi:MAG: HipA domain-containing protein [Flavobacteriaceae bacterium]|nr:HipA domain-containing protein [Flavobacteriaceae bacterium]
MIQLTKELGSIFAYILATNAGIQMAVSKAEKVIGDFHTFFTKRFDRDQKERIHFVSAMTITDNNESMIKENPASYLDIAEFIQTHCNHVDVNLAQLWRRIVFNIAISNTDDHLRNHGFIIKNNEWELSPAYDINPSIDKDGLALNIDMENNALNFELAKSVGEYFRLTENKMNLIIEEVLASVKKWESIAKKIGISNQEIQLMSKAFIV